MEANKLNHRYLILILSIFITSPAMASEGGGYVDQNSTSTAELSDGLEEIIALAEQGDPEAQNTLAWHYEEGIGVRRNYESAARWYQLAAEQGVFQAQESLGNLYYLGLGVPQSYSEAFRWTHLAAEQGLSSAQYNLGNLYATGQGVRQDYEKAAMWFLRAAKWGDDEALANLSSIYGQGQGVPENLVLAFIYASLAADLGNENGAYNRDFAASMLTEQQITEGEQLASEWVVGTPLPTETETWP